MSDNYPFNIAPKDLEAFSDSINRTKSSVVNKI